MRGVGVLSEFLKLQGQPTLKSERCGRPHASGGVAVYCRGEGILPQGTTFKIPLGRHREGLTCPFCPCQMWTSVWKGPTTATSTPSARTPHGRTSASASLATRGMVNTAKVRLGGYLEKGELPEGEAVPPLSVGHAVHEALHSLLAWGRD